MVELEPLRPPVASTTQPPLRPMDKLFKGRKGKGPKVVTSDPSQNSSGSTSTEQSDLPIERIDWAVEITGIVKDISEASPLLAPLKATCLLIIRGLELAREMHQTRLDLQEVTEVLNQQKKAMEAFAVRLEGGDMKGSPVLQTKLEIYLRNIREALVEKTAPMKETKHKHFDLLRRTRPTSSTQEDITAIKQNLNASYQDFMDTALLIASEKAEERALLAIEMHEVSKMAEHLNQQEQVEQVENEPEYDYDSPLPLLYGHGIPCCQPGTRTAVLADIDQWAMDARTKDKIYWIKDAAGTGKTTVAATCARDWQIKQTLAGRFFFTPNSQASSGIDRFCTTVAKDIAFLVPSIDSVITAVLDELSRRRCGFHEQFERLIVKPLGSAKLSHPVVLIFDALDNCDPDGRRILLNCLLEHLPNIPHVRVLLTSRPSPDILDILSTSSLVRGQEVQLLDIHDEVRADVRIYIHSTLTRLDDEEREKLVEYSGGLFIVAATACRMLRLSTQPTELLNRLLLAESRDHLDELYLEVLRQAVWNAGAHERMMSVLQVIIVTLQPVSTNTIAHFLSAKFDVGKFVRDLGAVLKDGHPERPIKVLHPTFREFLAEIGRANGFLVNPISSHALTAIGCLNTLQQALNYDLLRLHKHHQVLPRNVDVQDLSTKLAVATNAAVRYASSYWTHHVTASLENADLWPKALEFLRTKLLNWLELMSLRGDLGVCVKGLSQLRSAMLRSLRERQDSFGKHEVSTLSYAYQFLLRHQAMIQESALHTYSSALAFTPDSNPIFQNYAHSHLSNMPRIVSTAPTQWSMKNAVSGHTGDLEHVTFSPDGSRLVTIAQDRSLILWDTTSGAIVGQPFKVEGNDKVASAAFSTDSQRLVFATKSSKIRLWSTNSATQVGPTMEAKFGGMAQVAFAGSWPQILSASSETANSTWKYGNNLQLWSASTGQKIGQTMQLKDGVRYFSVSPDASRVLCVSRRRFEGENIGPVTFWSLESFSCLAEFDMPVVYGFNCTSYSPTANRWATWDQLGTLYLNDGLTGDRINRIKGHKDGVMEADFSLNGDILASFGRGEHTILLWSAATGVLERSLSGHTDVVMSISFAQDGTRMASISRDQTVRVWNINTGESMESFFTGYIGDVDWPTLSPDWSKLVTVTVSYQINLHDIDAGTMHGNDAIETTSLDFSTPYVAFSPTGDTMVCGFTALNDTSQMDLWSVETCSRIGAPMTEHNRGILGVAFSPDGRIVASVAEDSTVRIWNASDGCQIGAPFPIHDAHHVIFSPDSRFVASSGYEEMKVWDVRQGECVWSIASGSGSGTCAFSSSSTHLAGQSKTMLCLWGFMSRSITPIICTTDSVQFKALAFDSTDTLLASSFPGTIRLWKVTDEFHLLAEIPVEPKANYRLGISLDSGFLAYGWLVWDISRPSSPVLLSIPGKYMQPLDWRTFPHSLLAYDEGWIYSASPPGPLMPVPRELWNQFSAWHAYGTKIVVWNQQRLPIVIDCEPLLS